MIPCSISVHWLWDDFLCFFRLFYSNTCCSHWSALGLCALRMSLCSDSAAPGAADGELSGYTTRPWTPSQICPFTLAPRKELGLSAMHREGLDSHIPKHLALSPPQVLHHVLLIWSSHSSTLHSLSLSLSNPWWCSVLPGRCSASTSTCLSENGKCSASLMTQSLLGILFKYTRHCHFNITKALVETVVIGMAGLSSLALNCFQITGLILSYLQFLVQFFNFYMYFTGA